MDAPAAPPARHGRRRRFGAAIVLAGVLGVLGIGEAMGWPWLAVPLQSLLSKRLERKVTLLADTLPDAPEQPGFSLRLLGGIRLYAPTLEIAAPAWSQAPYTLQARQVSLLLRYVDVWRALQGERLRVQSFMASQLDGTVERLADGRASWSIAPQAAAPAPPLLAHLRVNQGSVRLRDALSELELQIKLSLVDLQPEVATLRADAVGRFRGFPVTGELAATGPMPWQAAGVANVASTLTMKAQIGRANFSLDGSVNDFAGWQGLNGRFTLKGPSLAAVGDALRVTLPTTAAFSSRGRLARQGSVWRVVVDEATIGASHLSAAVSYDTAPALPMLAGRIGGTHLAMVDLGPVVGVVAAPGVAKAKVLPVRPFDLASLRRMNANLLLDINEVDMNTRVLEPLRPLRVHLVLDGGVLRLNQIDARTADGRLFGDAQLDGRADIATWRADLKWQAVRLERWIHLARTDTAPPWISGRLNGGAVLQGQGRSTADILASLQGKVHAELREGSVSHLAIEVAGLDLAEGLGLLIKGDDALAVPCAVADLEASGGVLRPRLVVLDTKDSVVWIDGSLSLKNETLDLRAIVAPKDFSPLTLRTPLRVRGSFAQPEVTVQKDALGRKLGASVLLGLLNPLAALIPLIDPGDRAAASVGAADCQNLRQRGLAKASPTPRTTPNAKSARVRSPAHGPAPTTGLR